MDEIIALARQLGNQIAAHARTRAFAAAANTVTQDATARQILTEYQRASAQLQEKEGQGQPITPEDRQKLGEMEAKLATNDHLKNMMRYQADYIELMHRVNEAIDRGSQEGLSQGG